MHAQANCHSLNDSIRYVHTANYLIPARGKKSTFPFKYGFWPGNLANQLKVENRILITLTLLVVMIICVCVCVSVRSLASRKLN